MTTLPTLTQIDKAQQKTVWDFGNKILYDLCYNNFNHSEPQHTLTKVLFIGRIYSAAVERRKKQDTEINDNFYIETVEPTFRTSQLDTYLSELTKNCISVSKQTIQEILEAHFYLTTLLKTITNLEKRSFSSKYLHFHLPDLFYIYDSRTSRALRKFKVEIPNDLQHILTLNKVDKEYATFACKMFSLKCKIQDEYNITLTNRELDNLLLEMANNDEIEKVRRKTTGNIGIANSGAGHWSNQQR